MARQFGEFLVDRVRDGGEVPVRRLRVRVARTQTRTGQGSDLGPVDTMELGRHLVDGPGDGRTGG